MASCCLLILVLMTTVSQAQNNLAAGDLAFVSYQSDQDPSNAGSGQGGTTDFVDRFSIVVLKSNGLDAGTVIYFTDNGWNAGAGVFITGLSEGFIKWVVPTGGVPFGTEVYFISHFNNPVTTWGAYTTESGITTLGTVTTESGGNAMELSTTGDQVLVYQTGPTTGPAGTYDNTTRRFITAIHANVETGITIYTDWDGNAPVGANQSSVPPGLTNGTNAVLLSQSSLPTTTSGVVEPDNGKYNLGSISSCSVAALNASINNSNNWLLNNAAFVVNASSAHGTYTLNNPVVFSLQPSPATGCSGKPVSFTVTASGTGTLGYQWQESADATFNSPVSLSNSTIYNGVNTTSLNITDNTGLGSRYYRATVTNVCGTVNSTGALLTVNPTTLPVTATSATQAVTAGSNLFFNSCALITKIVPSGASAVTGAVTSQVWVESSVPTVSSQPFVARHYQILPAANATTATGSITLYFSQAEFDAFNAAPGSTADLPVSPGDNNGKANLRLVKYAGSSNDGTGLPASYTSGSAIIDPTDVNIVWNAVASRWEVTFDVTGFGGFTVQSIFTALPINLTAFSGRLINNDVLLQWETASETQNDYFEVEKSADGVLYTAIARIPGNNGNMVQKYSIADKEALHAMAPKLFYRLKIVSTSGQAEYSHIVIITANNSSVPVISVTPNPFTTNVMISAQMPEVTRLAIKVTNVTGQLLKSEYVNVGKGQTVFPVSGMWQLDHGVYLLSVTYNGQTHTYKLIK